MPSEIRTRPVTSAHVAYLSRKAEEFLAAARQSLEAGYSLAATSLAVHAGISASDAICGALIGERAAGATTVTAVALLGRAGAKAMTSARVTHATGALKNRPSTSLTTCRRRRRNAQSSKPTGSSASHAR